MRTKRKPSCKDKIGFATEDRARSSNHALKLREKGFAAIPYRCGKCGLWHLRS